LPVFIGETVSYGKLWYESSCTVRYRRYGMQVPTGR
jgi:hypothetical protein